MCKVAACSITAPPPISMHWKDPTPLTPVQPLYLSVSSTTTQ